MSKFEINDRVKVVAGGLTGRKGTFVDVVPEDCCRVKLDGVDDLCGFFEYELELDEAEMVKVYGQASRKIAGLM